MVIVVVVVLELVVVVLTVVVSVVVVVVDVVLTVVVALTVVEGLAVVVVEVVVGGLTDDGAGPLTVEVVAFFLATVLIVLTGTLAVVEVPKVSFLLELAVEVLKLEFLSRFLLRSLKSF